jgi:hypothetical protein
MGVVCGRSVGVMYICGYTGDAGGNAQAHPGGGAIVAAGFQNRPQT